MKAYQPVIMTYRTAQADKGQEYQWILQPFRFMDGDNLDQLSITFQPHYLVVSGLGNGFLLIQMLIEIAQQRMHTIQFDTGLLQQLGQVQ